jgi:hypothetical protein
MGRTNDIELTTVRPVTVWCKAVDRNYIAQRAARRSTLYL